MEEAFGYLIFGVVAIAVVVAVISLRGDRYAHVGRGGLFEEESRGEKRRAPPEPTGAVAIAQRDEEVRQMVDARNARRARRGEAPLDVDAEIARLTRGPQPSADPALVAEVRVLVEKRNARRVRKGQEPLDVEAEVARQLRELGG